MRPKAKDFFFWIKALVIAVAGVLLLQLFAFSSCYIPSSGMENSLYRGDQIIINKWAYGLRLPFMSAFGYKRINECPVHKNDIVIFNNPQATSTTLPADKRKVFISRCMGLPGDTLMISNQYSIICPRAEVNPDHKQLYVYPKEKESSIEKNIKKLGIEDNRLLGYNKNGYVRSFSRYEIYLLNQEIPELKIKSILPDTCKQTRSLVVPGKGRNIRVTPWNIYFLKNAINEHEGKKAFIIKDSLLYVNGEKVSSFVFTKDYYWMVSNNSININDSRIFGFVPKDYIIGKASFVWFSKDSQAGLFGGYRWKRFFQSVK